MNDLTRGNEGKAIFFFTLPMLIGSIFQQFYNTADSIIVGQFIGKDAMASVSGANPIMFLLMSLLMGVGVGFTILISQYYGAKDIEKVKKTINTVYIFVFIATLLITILGLILSKPILTLMKTPDDVLYQSQRYLMVIFSGTIFTAGYNSISAILRGLGDSKTPLYFLILATVLNIILDIIFIVVFKMGVEGVAFATIIAQGVSFICSIVYLNKTHNILKIKLKEIRYDKDIFLLGLRLGVPSGLQQMLFGIGNVALQSLVNSYGIEAMAAFGASSKIESFIALPIMNLGAAVSTFVGQNLGAGENERVKNGVRASLKFASILSIFVAIFFIVFDSYLIGLFNSDTEVIRIGSAYLNTIGPFFIFISISFILTSAIKGAGDSVFALISAMISLWIARIPGAYLFAALFGVNGIWMGIPMGWLVGFVITVVYYKKEKWKSKVVINNL